MITGMDEDVAIRNLNVIVETVSVADADDAHCAILSLPHAFVNVPGEPHGLASLQTVGI